MKELIQTNWHEVPANQVAAIPESDSETGLGAGEVEARLRQFGPKAVRAEAWLYIVAIGLFTFAAVVLEKWLRFSRATASGRLCCAK